MTSKEMIRIRNNEKCFTLAEKIKNYVCDGLDLYSVFASLIFDKPYHKCTGYVGNEKDDEAFKRRQFAKKLLLANASFEEIYNEIYQDGNSEDMKIHITNCFPYAPYDEINEDLDDVDRAINSFGFISWIFGYVKMCKAFEDQHISTRKYNNVVPESSDLF